jgi:hypothetical protein
MQPSTSKIKTSQPALPVVYPLFRVVIFAFFGWHMSRRELNSISMHSQALNKFGNKLSASIQSSFL